MAKGKERLSIGKFFYWLRYRVGEYGLRGVVRLLPWIPYSVLTFIAAWSARITFAIWLKYPKRMEENLAAAMGEEIPTPEERRAVVLKAWKNFARGALEAAVATFTRPEKILSAVRIEGEENLKEAFAPGKGVLALSAHLGNFTMIGIIMLMGLVTKNGILLVDFTNLLRGKGEDRRVALLHAARIRLRPIIMTTAAMIFGMLPLALAIGEGAEERAPMARAVIGGLITSTLLTLLVVPVMYTLMDDFAAWVTSRKRGERVVPRVEPEPAVGD